MKIIVNGCFDNLHHGHKFILSYAKMIAGHEGTIIVLLNSDKSVKQLKGEDRPKQNSTKRSTDIVDFFSNMDPDNPAARFRSKLKVLIFDTEEELSLLIDGEDPDMIIKGNDRTDVKEIVGSDKWPVCILPRLKDKDGKDISTTRILEEENG